MKPQEIIVNDLMQRDYRYLLTEPIGQCFHPEFVPELTPQQMLEMGVFGGKYMTDCQQEFPVSWFNDAKLSPLRANPDLNYFKKIAAQAIWRADPPSDSRSCTGPTTAARCNEGYDL